MSKLYNQIKSSEIRKFTAEVTSSPVASRKFLQRAGILNKNGTIAAPYREDKSKISYRYSKP